MHPYFISGFQCFVQLLAHPVMLDGKESGVQDDAGEQVIKLISFFVEDAEQN